MASCTHQQWVGIQQENSDFVLQYGNRLRNIAGSLPRPAKQYPSLISFIGKQSKTRALRNLFPGAGISNYRRYGVAKLCVDQATINEEHPILVADSCPEYTHFDVNGKDAFHELTNYPVAWPDDEEGLATRQELSDYVHTRVLSLFIDVLCIFASDCGGLDDVADRIIKWIAIGSASNLPASTRPRLLVVTSIPGHTFNSEVLRFRLKLFSHPGYSESFSSFNVINILSRPSPDSFSALKEVIHAEIGLARRERANADALFSMIHVAGFFDKALRNFAESPLSTFDFIKSSRENNPVSPNFKLHLEAFVDLSWKQSIRGAMLWDLVASAIIFDNFLPDMHRKCSSDTSCLYTDEI